MDLQQKQIQTGQLNLQQMQSLSLLQFNVLEMENYIKELALENPVIEFSDKQSTRAENADISIDTIKWMTEGSGFREGNLFSEEKQENFVEALSTDGGFSETILQSILRQVEQLSIEKRVKQTVCYLAACLDEDGYLRTPLYEIADETGMPIEIVRQSDEVLRSLEPAGVGARDLSDCLVLQLQRSGEDPIALRIAQQYLEELSQGRQKEIAKELQVPVERVGAAREKILSLTPRPGEQFASERCTHYIYPDIIIEKNNNDFSAHLAKESSIFFSISPTYLKMLEESNDAEVQTYLANKIKQAKMIQNGLLQRERSIRSCAEIIVSAQKEFFTHGEEWLAPLSMRDAAAAMGVHLSTAYRIVKGKYVQCAFGVFPMGYFFSCSGDGGKPSYHAVALKAVLKRLIEENSPMSDRELCEEMKKQGYEISRRTIAKYRAQLGIRNSYQRKR